MTGCVLAVDQGTSATKALVVAGDGTVRAAAEMRVTSRHLGADGVEADPEQLWASVLDAARLAAERAERAGEPLVAVALANQGETVLAWDRATGQPLSPAISWQDRRSEGICAALRAHRDEVRQLTGLELDPYFSAPKMRWLRDHVTQAGVITTTDAWLLHRLTGAFVTDAATASRTLLLDLEKVSWSERMCSLFGIDPESLPHIAGNAVVVGTTTAFGGELPVAGIAVDQQAALFAEACLDPAQAKCTFGTGAFLLVTVGARPARPTSGMVSCVAWRLGDVTTYCLDGQVYSAGAAADWLQRIGVLADPADLDRLGADAVLAGEAFVPAFTGLGAPYWAPTARASLTGLSMGTGRGGVVRAVLEGIAANVAVVARAAGYDLGAPIARLRADGGLTGSRVLMQAQADLLQVPVEVYATPHATALGVAALARLALGEAATPAEAVSAWEPAATYQPGCGPAEAERRLSRWQRAALAAVELGTADGN